MSLAAPAPAAEPGDPQLDLGFVRSPAGETYLARQYAAFPFHMTRPFRLDDAPAGMATVVLQSLGAGLLRGDRLAMAIAVDEDAEAHVTTQGSTVAHATPGGEAVQVARLSAAAGALLEYLPRPMILFPGARVTTSLEIVLAAGATAMWCDAYLMHDPHGIGGRFDRLKTETVLRNEAGRTLAIDRFELAGADIDAAGLMDGYAAHAGLGIAGEVVGPALAATWRETLGGCDGVYGGVSALPNDAGVFCRLLAGDGIALRRAILALWRAARVARFGVEPGARP